MSKSCKHQNDFKYDNCAYNENGKLLRKKLNCSFEFLFGNSKSSNGQRIMEECKLLDVSESGKEPFRDIAYGNTNSSLKLLTILRELT